MTVRKGYGINPAWTAQLRGPSGRGVCKWCLREVPQLGLQWCSRGCRRDYQSQRDQHGLRMAVWRRDRGVCALCPTGTPAHAEWHADHVQPLVEGGSFGPANARTLCVPHHKQETKALAQRRAEARRGIAS